MDEKELVLWTKTKAEKKPEEDNLKCVLCSLLGLPLPPQCQGVSQSPSGLPLCPGDGDQ